MCIYTYIHTCIMCIYIYIYMYIEYVCINPFPSSPGDSKNANGHLGGFHKDPPSIECGP